MQRRVLAALVALAIILPSGASVAQNNNGGNNRTSSQKSDEPAARMTFETMNHDFGTLTFKGAARSFDFRFVNDGTAPLVVTRYTTTCSCIRVTIPKKPIPVGGHGTITVTYDPKKDLGAFHKGINIFSNSSDKRQIVVVKGNVVENK